MKGFSLAVLLLFVLTADGLLNERVWRGRRRRLTADRLREQNTKIHRSYMRLFPEEPLEIELKIGTPQDPSQDAPTFYLAVETGENQMWTLSPNYQALYDDRQTYDPNKSKTSVSRGENAFYGRSGDFGLTGDLYSDIINVNDIIFNQTFGQVYTTDSREVPWNDPYFIMDGVIGLGWNDSEPIHNLLAGFPLIDKDSRYYVLWIDDGKNIGDDYPDYSYDWQITFGSLDNCKNNFTLLPLNSYTYTSQADFFLDTFIFGQAYRYDLNGQPVQLDTGMAVIAMPYDVFQTIIMAFDWLYQWDWGVFSVDCSTAGNGTYADWTFTLDVKNFTIPASTYIIDIGLTDGQCVIAGQSTDDDFQTEWVLGNPFAVHRCIKFDVGNGQIGFEHDRSV
ncbi:Peptidase A1 domain-containing protein [Aphelenchoides fujianensis]|nr:Peptidase A1 domain-containing protein [Aphelenchoides fujianensis]